MTDLSIGIAFIGGLLSFLSPCVLPLLPVYLSILSTGDPEKKTRLGPLSNSIFFVLGFSFVFVLLAIIFSSLFGSAGKYLNLINIISGSAVIILGLNIIFDFIKILNFEKRFNFSIKSRGRMSSLLLGFFFGAGWSPCVGPILGSILFFASSSGDRANSVFLLAAYSIGLGLPFIISGLFFNSQVIINKIKKHFKMIRIISGSFLIFLGLLIISGSLRRFNAFASSLGYLLRDFEAEHSLLIRIIFSSIFLFFTGKLSYSFLKNYRESKKIKRDSIFRIIIILLMLSLVALILADKINILGIIVAWLNYSGA